MEPYKNIEGGSGVKAYELGDDHIVVEFQDGSKYIYCYIRPGRNQVDTMKALAHNGLGLNRFIDENVKRNYFRKVK